MRCASSHAYNCQYQVKIVVNYQLKTVTVLESRGWPHTHSGECTFKRGLPPPLKADIDAALKLEPRCKLQ